MYSYASATIRPVLEASCFGLCLCVHVIIDYSFVDMISYKLIV